MVTLKGIEVHVVSSSDNCELLEYDNPNAGSSSDENTTEKFIEAVTDLTYHIKINVNPCFKLYDADGILIWLKIDGGVVSHSRFYDRDRVVEKQRTGSSFIDDSFTYQEGSVLRKSKYSFGSLNIGKSYEILVSLKSNNAS